MSKYSFEQAEVKVKPEAGVYLKLEDGTEIDIDDCEFALMLGLVSHDEQPPIFLRFGNALLCTESVIIYLTQQDDKSYINVDTSGFELSRRFAPQDITKITMEDLECGVSCPDTAACASSEAPLGGLPGFCREDILE